MIQKNVVNKCMGEKKALLAVMRDEGFADDKLRIVRHSPRPPFSSRSLKAASFKGLVEHFVEHSELVCANCRQTARELQIPTRNRKEQNMLKKITRALVLVLGIGIVACSEDECETVGEEWCEDNIFYWCEASGGDYGLSSPFAGNVLNGCKCIDQVCVEFSDGGADCVWPSEL